MTNKRQRYNYLTFSYELFFHDSHYICRVNPDLVYGISDTSPEEAIQDAIHKLQMIPNIEQYQSKHDTIVKINFDEYKSSSENLLSHIFS